MHTEVVVESCQVCAVVSVEMLVALLVSGQRIIAGG